MSLGPKSLLWLLCLCVSPAFAGQWTNEAIAHYRFDSNGLDSLGRGPPFLVTNGAQSIAGRSFSPAFVIADPPFTNGVLYVNGRYEPNGHFVHYLGTSPIREFQYEAFTVALDFYPLPMKRSRSSFNSLEEKLDAWTRGRYAKWRGVDPTLGNIDNILTGGYMYRWVGVNRQGDLLNLTLNNQAFAHRFAGASVKAGRWHQLICSVDLRRRKILTLFDGRLLESITLPADFKLEVAGTPEEARDREFTFSNYSNGSVFFGYAAHLKILGRALGESELADFYKESAAERPTFPAPQSEGLLLLLLASLAGLAVLLWLRTRFRRRRAAGVSAVTSDG